MTVVFIRRGNLGTNVQREDDVKSRGEDGHLPAKERGLKQILPLRPQKEPTLPTAWSWTSNLQNREKINFCCLRHSVCSTLLWQPEQINTIVHLKEKWAQCTRCHSTDDPGCPSCTLGLSCSLKGEKHPAISLGIHGNIPERHSIFMKEFGSHTYTIGSALFGRELLPSL